MRLREQPQGPGETGWLLGGCIQGGGAGQAQIVLLPRVLEGSLFLSSVLQPAWEVAGPRRSPSALGPGLDTFPRAPRPRLPRPQDGRCRSSGALSKVGTHSQKHKLFMTLETGSAIMCDLLVRRPQVLYLGFVVVSGVGLMTESIIPKSSFGRPTKIISARRREEERRGGEEKGKEGAGEEERGGGKGLV